MSLSKKISRQHIACPFCPSSDAYCEYADGHGFCFSCGNYKGPDRERQDVRLALSSPRRLNDDKRVLQYFDDAQEPLGTLVEKYLAARGLHLFDRCHEVVRFHPKCPFGKGERLPCLVALYRDIHTNTPKAIHRTALTRNGEKIDRKVLGPKGGCAIKLTPDEDVHDGLTIGEGLETTLAAMQLNFMPAWALGDAGSLAKFPILSGIETLTILVDNDKNGVGQMKALECSRRWTSHGREVFRVLPTTVGSDMADIIPGRAA